MADQPNEIDVRINVDLLKTQVEEVKAIFADLFASLEKYDAKGIAPIRVEGLSDLNKSMKETGIELQKLTGLLSTLDTAITKQATTSRTSKQATDELGASMQQYNKTTQENITLQAKINVLDTDAAKKKAELNAQLKAEQTNLKNNTTIAQQDIQIKKLQSDMEARLTRQKKEQAAADAQYQRELKQTRQQAATASIEERRQMEREAKEALNTSQAYFRLKETVKELENEYARLHASAGENDPLTKEAFERLQDANIDLDIMNEKLQKAGSGGAGLGKGLTEGLSAVRNLAYILPGLGMAGIFNLAYEAVQKLIDGFINMNKVSEESVKSAGEWFDKLLQILETYRDVKDVAKELFDLTANSAAGLKRAAELSAVAGSNAVDVAEANRQAAERAFQEAQAELDRHTSTAGGYKELFERIQKENEQIEKTRKLTTDAEVRYNADTNNKKLERDKNYLQERLKEEVDTRDQQKKILENYFNALVEFRKADIDAEKIYLEERRKMIEDNNNAEIAQDLIKQERILGAARSTEKQRLEAVKREREDKDKAAIQTYESIRDAVTPQGKKVFSDAQINQALDEMNTALLNNKEEAAIKSLAITDEYELRDLEAVKQTEEAKLQTIIDTNKAIIADDKKTYNERLNALGQATQARIQQANIEFQHFQKTKTYTDKTPDEQTAEQVKFAKNIQAIYASVPATIRDITTSFSKQRLKQLDEENTEVSNSVDVNIQYAAALDEVNKRFIEGAISYRRFSEAKGKIEYGKLIQGDIEQIHVAEGKIENDKKAISDFDVKIQQAALGLQIAKRKGDEKEIQGAKDKYDILVDGQDAANAKLLGHEREKNDAIYKYDDDLVKARLKFQEQLKANWKKIGDEIIALAQQIMDTEYENRRIAVERNIELIDKQYEHEINAVNKSSLAQKDKTALEIQLNAEKEKSDEEAAKKLRRIAHDKAIADKVAAMAHIVWDTEQAIAGAISQARTLSISAVPFAVSLGILGALALAKAAATPVPPLALGTEDWKGGTALVGEAGRELVKEPGKYPYYVNKPTVKYLPKHTEVVPQYSIPTISERNTDNGWERTKWLASQIKKDNKKTQQKIVNNIHIDLGWETYKYKILYG